MRSIKENSKKAIEQCKDSKTMHGKLKKNYC